MRQPTGDECNERAVLDVSPEGQAHAIAAWTPQIGGYVGRAIIAWDADEATPGCFTAYAWHDGEFPTGEEADPESLHHCSAIQFGEFAADVLEAQCRVGAQLDAGEARRVDALIDRLRALPRRT